MGGGAHRAMLLFFGLLLLGGSGLLLWAVAPLPQMVQMPRPLGTSPMRQAAQNEDSIGQRIGWARAQLDDLAGMLRRAGAPRQPLPGALLAAVVITPLAAIVGAHYRSAAARRLRALQRPQPAPALNSRVIEPAVTTAQAWIQSDEDDRRCAAAIRVVTAALDDGAYRSCIAAVSVARNGAERVLELRLAAHPDDRSRFGALLDGVRRARPHWQVSGVDERLEITGDPGVMSVGDLPLMLPVLMHEQRGVSWSTSVLLDTVAHLGIFGADARAMLQAMLSDTLCTYGPRRIQATIIGAPGIARVFAAASHVAIAPDDPLVALRSLREHGTHAQWLPAACPVLVVIVEPDEALLNEALEILRSSHDRAAKGVHIILVMDDAPRPVRAERALAILRGIGHSAQSSESGGDVSPDELHVGGVRLRGYAPRQSADDVEHLLRLLPFSLAVVSKAMDVYREKGSS